MATSSLANGATPEVDRLITQFRAESVFWKQADIGNELARVARLGDVLSLEPWLTHDDRRIRGNAAFLFAKLGDPRGFDTLVGILRDDSAHRTIHSPMVVSILSNPGEIRTEADWFATYKRSPEALRSTIETDRYYTVHLLGELRDPRAVDLLIPLLDRDENNYKVAWALGEIGDVRAIRPLIIALGNADAHVRVSAIGALEKLRAVEALPHLTALFSDDAIPHAGDQVPVGTTAKKAAEAIQRATRR